MRRRLLYLFISNFLLLAPLAFSGCGEVSRHGEERRPNVVLITIDTLRADHLSCYGYGRETTPFLDSLAEEGCIFTNCSASSSWTAPSIASLFTGLYPRSHGVRHGFVREGDIVNQERLDSSFLTLAEAMREKGYATFGISANGHISAGTGLAQGFDEFAALWFKDAPAAHRKAKRMKESLEASEPYFLWLFYFDPHLPYRDREPWLEAYSPDPENARKWSDKHVSYLRREKERFREDPEKLNALIDLYDSEINYTDRFIERLFREVVTEKNALMIVTADHGEGFLDHGQLGHSRSLFEEEVHVPLIVREPGGRKKCVVTEPVTLLDVFPTILDFVGAPILPNLQGRSLLPFVKGGGPEGERALFCELDRGRNMKSIREGRWKLIQNGDEKRRMLFDLQSDPAEREDLAGERAETASRLEERLRQWEEELPLVEAPQEEKAVGEEREEALKSMGYLQ